MLPPRAPATFRKPGAWLCNSPRDLPALALKTGESVQPSPASKASPGLLRSILPTRTLGLAHPSTYPPPHRHTPTASAKAQTGSEQEMKKEEGARRAREGSLGAGERKEESREKG